MLIRFCVSRSFQSSRSDHSVSVVSIRGTCHLGRGRGPFRFSLSRHLPPNPNLHVGIQPLLFGEQGIHHAKKGGITQDLLFAYDYQNLSMLILRPSSRGTVMIKSSHRDMRHPLLRMHGLLLDGRGLDV